MNAKELDEAIKALPTHNYHVAMSDFYAARLALVLKVVREYTEAVDKPSEQNAEANLRTILQLEGT